MYIIEGNIGAGKSTFLNLIKIFLPQYSVHQEPVDTWHKKKEGQSLLESFYTTPKRWAYTLETLSLINRVKEHLAIQEMPGISIAERSVYSGNYCFAKNGYLNQFLDPIEWFAYNEWFNFMVPGKCKTPTGFIYLQVSPEKSYERVLKRNRSSENGLTLEYLKEINKRHEEFLIQKYNVLPELQNIPVLILNVNENFDKHTLKLQEHLNKVEKFIEETQVQKLTNLNNLKTSGIFNKSLDI
ncbi:MAG: Deoxynucleoside kinase [candidate division TM6 bacterium GW2011_GWF2_32_72]|nr:MAG: Deoxynucleoside kinase [candidate division TM6 bacterium GW2011_GWF2_32_72]